MTVKTGMPVHFDPPSGPMERLVRKRPCASQVKSGWVSTPIGLPSGASRKAMPAKAANVPSVAMVGLIFRPVMIPPLIAPATIPARMPARTAINTLPVGKIPSDPTVPNPTRAEAATTEPIEVTEPTEMSSPPAMMMTVSPMASSPTITTA